jgi:hypothetical protein
MAAVVVLGRWLSLGRGLPATNQHRLLWAFPHVPQRIGAGLASTRMVGRGDKGAWVLVIAPNLRGSIGTSEA